MNICSDPLSFFVLGFTLCCLTWLASMMRLTGKLTPKYAAASVAIIFALVGGYQIHTGGGFWQCAKAVIIADINGSSANAH